jgi:ligand-binding sensor domain-containing protein/signal transduction histidine kinase
MRVNHPLAGPRAGAKSRALAARVVILWLACLVAPTASAASTNSPWVSQVWQSDEGLPNNDITSLAQTSDGYLWIANPSRLARFDGAQFESYSSRYIFPEGRDERPVLLFRSHDDGLWLGLEHGVVLFLKAGVELAFTNLPDSRVTSMTEDGEYACWVAYQDGTVHRILNGKVINFSEADGWTKDLGIFSLATDNKGRVWFAKNGRLGRFNDGRFTTITTLPRGGARLAAARNGGVWVAINNHLMRCGDTGFVQDPGSFPAETPTTDAQAMIEDHDGLVWIGTSDSGLFCLGHGGFEKVETSHREILSLTEDDEGNIWVGTAGGGLNRVQARAVMLEGTDAGLPFGTVQSLCEDKHNVVWAVTQNGLIVCRSNETWITLSGTGEWPDASATCVTADREGSIWIGTQNKGLYRWRDGRLTILGAADGMSCRNIKTLLATASGDLWIGATSPDCLQRYRSGQFKTFKMPAQGGLIRAMAEDSAGDVWIGTSKRVLLHVKGDNVTDEAVTTTKNPLSIRTLCSTPDGALWIGYAATGVGWLKKGQYQKITSAQGLYDDFITEIVADDQGWIWFGSDHGIFKVRQREFEDVAAGRLDRVRSVHYGRSAGLPSVQGNFGNAPGTLRSHDGRVWLPMRTALAVADPRKISPQMKPPPVLLTRVIIDDRVAAQYGGIMPVRSTNDLHNLRSALELEPGHHRLEFDFTALSFSAPENVRFRYRLDGVDPRWVDTEKQRSANYSRLPAGRYQFHVKACNSDGVWTEEGITFAFIVTPFFWQTWWFRLAVLGGLAAGIFGLARLISARRVQLKLLALDQENALEKSRMAGKAEVATTVLHNVGNVLNSINVSSTLIEEKIRKSRIANLGKVVAMLEEHAADLPAFFGRDPKGRQLPAYLATLSGHLSGEREEILNELKSLDRDIDHIKQIITSQQSYARASGLEPLKLSEVVEDAIRIHAGGFEQRKVKIIREFDELAPVVTDKHKVMQILINLIGNAKYALDNSTADEKRLVIGLHNNGDDRVKIAVTDNGMGISPENLAHMFQYGFTTRKEGHGFGLHSGALTAKELGGSLTVHSEGLGRGASFILEIPRQPKKTDTTK